MQINIYFLFVLCIEHYVVMSDVPLINQYYRDRGFHPYKQCRTENPHMTIDCPINDNTGIYTATEKVI